MADDSKKKTKPIRLLGLDLETTGLDLEKDQITEISFAVKDIGNPKILLRKTFLISKVEGTPAISDEIFKLTGITDPMRKEFGVHMSEAITALDDVLDYGIDYICGHNGDAFDRPFLLTKDNQTLEGGGLSVRFLNTPWIDTTKDLPYPDGMDTRKLKYLAFEHGILGHHAHDSLSDVETMLKLFDHYDETEILKHIKEPNLIVRIHTGYPDREEAKRLRYQWEKLGSEKFDKIWVKRIKASDLEKERAKTKFELTILREENRL